MKIREFICIFTLLVAFLFVVGFAAKGHAAEEDMLSEDKDKVKGMFEPETVVHGKDAANAESDIWSK